MLETRQSPKLAARLEPHECEAAEGCPVEMKFARLEYAGLMDRREA